MNVTGMLVCVGLHQVDKKLRRRHYWDDWNRGFRATAKTHDMMEVLDPTYVPTNTDDIALFEAKQTFMYSVFEEHLQTDMGKTLVCTHELMLDAQKIYGELCSLTIVMLKTSLQI
jgi:hypothetical protein